MLRYTTSTTSLIVSQIKICKIQIYIKNIAIIIWKKNCYAITETGIIIQIEY